MRSPLFYLGCLFSLAMGLWAIAEPQAVVAEPQKAKKELQAIDPTGEPKGFKAGDTVRYAVWHNKKGWHVRTTTARVERYFTGKIVVEGGFFTAVEPHDLEYKGRFGDWWRLQDNRKELVIDFKTDRGIDGINFQVSKEAARIHFNLHVDGKHQRDLIFIGRAGVHPTTDPLILVAHP